MQVKAKLIPSAKIHELISPAEAPAVVAAWNTIATELVKPTSTPTKPAVILGIEKNGFKVVLHKEFTAQTLGCVDNWCYG